MASGTGLRVTCSRRRCRPHLSFGSDNQSQSRGARVAAIALGVLLWLLSPGLAEHAQAVKTTGKPLGVEVNTSTNRIYAAIEDKASVAVIDGETNTALTSIGTGPGPFGVGLNPATQRLYVTHRDFDKVSVIDTNTDTVLLAFPLPGRPWEVATNPATNRIYITLNSEGKVAVIDGDTHNLVTTIPVGPPFGIIANQTTNRIYVANTDGTVSVIDGATNSVVKTIFVGGGAYGITVNPGLGRVYATVFDGSKGFVAVIDSGSNELMKYIQTPPAFPVAIDVNPVNSRVYVAHRENPGFVSVINGLNNRIVDRLYVGVHPYDIRTNPVTSRVYVGNEPSENVSVLLEDEVLGNPSFDQDEDRDGVPDRWKVKNFGPGDGLFQGGNYEGIHSFKFVGVSSLSKRLTQVVVKAGAAGTRLNLEAFSRADGASAAGGAYQVKVRILSTDGTSKAFAVDFTKGTHDWERQFSSFIAPKDFHKLVVMITYANQTGSAWFDALHLWLEPPGRLQ